MTPDRFLYLNEIIVFKRKALCRYYYKNFPLIIASLIKAIVKLIILT